MHKLNICLLPGIGLSEHYFDSLIFPAFCRTMPISLPEPEINETLECYAGRLMQKVTPDIPFVLIGMSFGGVLAQEMAVIRKPEAVILLSTIRHPDELPWYFRMGNRAGLTRVLPYKLVERVIVTIRSIAGKKNHGLYDNRTASAGYLAWSIEKMLNWKPAIASVTPFQIHGAEDRLLPCRQKNDQYVIQGATHLLLPRNSAELNRIIAEILSMLPALR